MESKHQLFKELLREFDSHGILKEVILIGSWCIPIYKEYYENGVQLPALRTQDVDFLIHKPHQVSLEVDVSQILESQGYEYSQDYIDQMIRFHNDELDVEFLSPRGRSDNKIEKVDKLGITTQALSHLDRIHKYTEWVEFAGVQVRIPEIGSFVLHKALIGPMRQNVMKKQKDAQTVEDMSYFLLDSPFLAERTKEIFNELPKPWRKKIKDSLQTSSPELLEFLN